MASRKNLESTAEHWSSCLADLFSTHCGTHRLFKLCMSLLARLN